MQRFGAADIRLEDRLMKISIRTAIGLILGAAGAIYFLKLARPAGWFDVVIAIIIAVAIVVIVKRFQGFK